MSYFDCFVASVPTEKKEEYAGHVRTFADLFLEHGALQVVDCWGDDVPDGKLTSFPMAVKAEAGETVVTGWIVWPSREARDAGMKAAMEDPRMSDETNPMPFDGKRMIFGGFALLNDTGRP